MKFFVITFLSLTMALCLVLTPAIAHKDEASIVEECEEYVENLELDGYCPEPSCFGLCAAVENVCKEKEKGKLGKLVCDNLGVKMLERCEVECDETSIVKECEEYVENLELDGYCPEPSCFGLCVAVENVCKEKEKGKLGKLVCDNLGVKVMERCEVECIE